MTIGLQILLGLTAGLHISLAAAQASGPTTPPTHPSERMVPSTTPPSEGGAGDRPSGFKSPERGSSQAGPARVPIGQGNVFQVAPQALRRPRP